MRRSLKALEELSETAGDAFDQAARGTRQAIGSTVESARDRLAELSEYAQSGADAVREGASTLSRAARRGYSTGRETFSDMWDDHPLVVCGAMLAAGIAAGMLLPLSRRESRLIAPASRRIATTVRSGGDQLLREGKRVASNTVQAVGREVRRQGLSPKELSQKVRRVADRAKNAAVGEVA